MAQTASGPDVPGVGAKKPSSDDGTYWKPSGAGGGGFLAGSVIAFSGAFGGTGSRFPIPLGGDEPDLNWVLCDGTETNGLPVPDLRDRMIIGAGNAYATGSKGGRSTHEHSLSGTVGATTLDWNTLPSHNHAGTTYSLQSWDETSGINNGNNFANRVETTGNSGGSHPHTHSLAASTGAANNMPPYYALAFIMRL